MKLDQLIETKYVGDEKPQFTNLSAEKVIEMFFDFNDEEEVDVDVFQKSFSPKKGLYIVDDVDGDPVTWLILRDGSWFSYVGSEGEVHANPAKFKIDMKRAIYRP